MTLIGGEWLGVNIGVVESGRVTISLESDWVIMIGGEWLGDIDQWREIG